MEEVTRYIEKHPHWQEELQQLRNLLLELPFTETVKWSAPVYTWQGKNVVGLGAFKHHYGLWFFQGDLLKDHAGVLNNAQEGKTRLMRQWRFTKENIPPLALVRDYCMEALKVAELPPPPKVKKKVAAPDKPDLLVEALKNDAELSACFDNFPPYKQKEFILHLTEAKRDSTRQNRLSKIIPMILEGKGLNDKYRS